MHFILRFFLTRFSPEQQILSQSMRAFLPRATDTFSEYACVSPQSNRYFPRVCVRFSPEQQILSQSMRAFLPRATDTFPEYACVSPQSNRYFPRVCVRFSPEQQILPQSKFKFARKEKEGRNCYFKCVFGKDG